MPELPPLAWGLILAALVVGILAGHFGWGRRWPALRKFNADYLTGLDYLVSEQPDRALDTFLKLIDANADTLETHFALGALYRRRGEVDRAIRIHRSLLAREGLAPEHREQALLALAQDHLRAGLLDRAEGLFQQVCEVGRLRATALDALRGIYERQHDWAQALDMHRRLASAGAPPPRAVAAHYACELATLALDRGEIAEARRLLRQARSETGGFARAAILRAQIAEREAQPELAARLLKWAVVMAPQVLEDELPHLLRLVHGDARDGLLAELVARAQSRDFIELKRLVFAALAARLAHAEPLRGPLEQVFSRDPALHTVWQAAGPAPFERIASELAALLALAERYRCGECGFAGRKFYWQCPGCHSWDSFEAYATVKLH